MKKLVLVAVLVMLVFAMVVPAVSAAPPAAGGYWYQVNRGDTLYGISWITGVPAQTIATANGIPNMNLIYSGTYLWIPAFNGSQVSAQNFARSSALSGTYHTVAWGETLNNIAVAHGVNMWSLAQANGIGNVNWIYVGQVLYIP